MKLANTTLLVVLVWFVACDNEDAVTSKYNFEDFWNAHVEQRKDSISVKTSLIGTWDWVFTRCCPESNQNQGRLTSNENVSVVIDSQMIEILRDGNLEHSTKWQLESKADGLFGLEMESFNSLISGRILFKDNIVLFNNSHLDGVDNYFINRNTGTE
ncbi:MAG: hypothetical protein RJQ09_18825 [Cyclobacteriaceae bacterium]